jgi:hypothetical protein
MRKSCSKLVQKLYTIFSLIPSLKISNTMSVEKNSTYPLIYTTSTNILNTSFFSKITDKFPFFYTLSTIPITTTTKLNIFIINN